MSDNRSYAQILLDEFSSICETNKLKFNLAWGPVPMGSGVVMTSADCKKFIEVVKSSTSENRAIDSWIDNPDYPDQTVRYVGLDSTAYNIIDFNNYKYHGIFVEINIARNKNESLSGKQEAAVETLLKNSAVGFTKPGQVKMQSVKEMFYKRALSKAGSIDALKNQTITKLLAGPEVPVNEKTIKNYKVKKYSADYMNNSIVEEDIDSRMLFGDDKFVESINSQLEEARKLRYDIDAFKKKGSANMKIAANAWKTVCRIDEEIKGE